MRKITSISIWGIVLIALLVSCDRSNQMDLEKIPSKENSSQTLGGGEAGSSSTPDTPPGKDEYICSGHQINRYYKLKELSVREEALKQDKSGYYGMTVEYLAQNFYGYRTPAAELSKFASCAEKFGDTASKMIFPDAIDEGSALSAYIKEVLITSAEGFDDAHPAGASLSDIVEVEYLTAYPSIKRGYNPVGLDGLIEPNVDSTDPRYGVQNISKPLAQVDEEELAMVYLAPENAVIYPQDSQRKHILYRLRFVKSPVSPVQTITIKIVTDEGTYATTAKVAFL